MKENMPVRGYFNRAKVFGYVLLAIAVIIVLYFTYNFFAD